MEKRKRARIASGYWHGQNAYVMERSGRDIHCILVGDFTEDEALEIRKLVREDNPRKLSEYESSLVYLEDSDEWYEQNS